MVDCLVNSEMAGMWKGAVLI